DGAAMTLAAAEDKTYRGAYIASPTMPWVWGTGLENPSGAYHLVWARDLYEIATALIADGDRAGAERALDYLFDGQQKADGSFPQNSTVDGAPHWGSLQMDKDANPIATTTYSLGDGGPSAIDQRMVVDPSYLELVRLGVKPADDPVIRSTMPVVDAQLGVDTPSGRFWHRYNHDGYGETRSGGPWDISQPDTFQTIGRIWPIFAGERGEYELAAGGGATAQLAAMANTANDGHLMPEQ